MASTTFRKATSFLKLLNPCSLARFQTQELLGFHPSRFFPTQNLRFSTTHQHYSSTRSSKNITTTVSFPNRRMIHDVNSSCVSAEVQELQVYEFNNRDRGSQKPENSFGVLVPFSNKIYTANLKKEIGITAGTRILIQHEKDGDRYEAVYSFYFNDYGHISVQGAYLTNEKTDLAVTGGSGNFKGVTGKVHLYPFGFPFKMLYTFDLGPGIPKLPVELKVNLKRPSASVEPEC